MNSNTYYSGGSNPITAGTTHSPRLLAIGVIGAAVVEVHICGTEAARNRLEGAAKMARALGVLDAPDEQLVARLLAGQVGQETKSETHGYSEVRYDPN